MVCSAELELTNSIVGVMRTTGPERIADGYSHFLRFNHAESCMSNGTATNHIVCGALGTRWAAPAPSNQDTRPRAVSLLPRRVPETLPADGRSDNTQPGMYTAARHREGWTEQCF